MIDLIQRHLQAIYDLEAPDVRDFLLDEDQLRESHGDLRPAREWVIVRQDADGVGLGVWFHPEDLGAVSERSPADAVAEALPAWASLTEGVSHFLLLVRRLSRDETVSLLELEAQAEVDKYVTARLHGRHAEARRLLDAPLAPDLAPHERERYSEAGRLARRYARRLDRIGDVGALLDELRRFYRLSGHARMDRLRHAA